MSLSGERTEKKMSKYRTFKQKMAVSIAAGMSVVLTALPVCAADGGNGKAKEIYKEETVYVKADTAGEKETVTVSDWLKGISSSEDITDQSILDQIKNIKGNETFTEKGNQLVWSADGKDIFYQGTTEKELPVSMKLTYWLDGKEIDPKDLKDRTGHLEIRIAYQNHEKRSISVNGKKEEVFSPIVMLTGLVLPNDTCSDVKIDNGKVINDGNKNIVLGVAVPGMKESLGVEEKDLADEALTLPEALTISADIKDFTMPSTYTIGLTDLMDDLHVDKITDFDSLSQSFDTLEDAALELVQGSEQLSDGADTLGSSYAEFDKGIDALKSGIDVLDDGAATLSGGIDKYTAGADALRDGIQKCFGEDGKLSGSVTEYKNGINTLLLGVQEYINGTDALADGVNAYVDGEEKLAQGADELTQLADGLSQVKTAVQTLSESVDGKGSSKDDLLNAAKELSAGTEKLNDAMGSDSVQMMLGQIDSMTKSGQDLIATAGELGDDIEKEIAEPASAMTSELGTLSNELEEINTGVSTLEQKCNEQIGQINQVVNANNKKIQEAKKAAGESSAQITEAEQELRQQAQNLRKSGQNDAAAQVEKAIQSLSKARTSADALSSLADLNTVDQVDFSGIDTTKLNETADSVEANIKTLGNASVTLSQKIGTLKEGLDKIEKMKDKLPEESMEKLSGEIDELNQGMQGLYQAVGSLAGGLQELNGASEQLQSGANGIKSLNEGFQKLGSYNEELRAGALKLQKNSPVLNQGAEKILGSTTLLADGVNTIGDQLLSGASALSAGSGELKDGAAALQSGTTKLAAGGRSLQIGSGQVQDGIQSLQSGASELASGMNQFEEEGISKIQEVMKTELQDIMDRLKALSSESCRYDSFGGKSDSMDGNVKFVIETEATEE